MLSIKACSMPDNALLNAYIEGGHYTDCYTTVINGSVSHAEYVFAFYTTSLFKLERIILKYLISKPSSDTEAKQLATGAIYTFAAWTVESRTKDQLLMCDFQGNTRSWFMLEPLHIGDSPKTRLYFGSAIVAHHNPRTGITSIGLGFKALLWVHKLYSRALLYSAQQRLRLKIIRI